jgi:hypothetical protein
VSALEGKWTLAFATSCRYASITRIVPGASSAASGRITTLISLYGAILTGSSTLATSLLAPTAAPPRHPLAACYALSA